ncbi:MAG: fimbrial protein [Bacteriovoracaceae bacterium]
MTTKFLKKSILSLTLMTLPVISFAATTGTLLLQGTIAQVLSISITPVSGVNNNLDLTSNATNLVVGAVQEVSNSVTGYKILLSSANAGKLNHASTSAFVSYTARYNGTAVTLSTTPQNIFNQSTAGAYNTSKNFDISYTGQAAANLVEGNYSDTLTFTIQAN